MPKGKWGIDADWSPKNSDGNYRGTITLQKALANSINTVSAKLIDQVGPQAVVDMAKELGVTSKIPVQPSIALGAVDITVEEMVGAMSTFANQGVYGKPTFIIKIEEKPKVEANRDNKSDTSRVSADKIDQTSDSETLILSNDKFLWCI